MKSRHDPRPIMPLADLHGSDSSKNRESIAKVDLFESASRSVMIPLSRLRPSSFNVRKIRTQSRIDEVAESLRKNNQREPITVYPGSGVNEGFYMMISGATRFAAALQLGWTELEAQIDESLSEDDPLGLVRVSHIHNDSAKETDYDHAVTSRELLEAGFTQIQVAESLGYKGNRQIARFNAYFELPESLLDTGKENPAKFTAHVAEIISKAAKALGEETALSLFKHFQSDLEMSRAELELSVQAATRKASRAIKPTRNRSSRSATFEIVTASGRAGEMKVLKVGDSDKRIQIDAKFDAAMADEIAKKIQNLFIELGEKNKDS